ncbi:flavin reductase family protein [Chromobacterium sp. ASV23]|uniref:flavin reductase family protein n=1 Tax=Chromobacterium sp. ASV23 TaxID=2795110 RepID=UPI0018EC992B|nr:flavin reductase family protein [Chromobacterium sp. ASV23]
MKSIKETGMAFDLVRPALVEKLGSERIDIAGTGQQDAILTGFKKAMRRLTATVSIITTGEQDQRFGMVATAVSSVSTEPPAVLICVNHSASMFHPLMRAGRFAVNMLTVESNPLVPVFSGKVKGQERFEYGDWTSLNGLPCLKNAQAVLCCAVVDTFTYGSHEIVIGQVKAVEVEDEISPLLWQDGKLAVSHLLNA